MKGNQFTDELSREIYEQTYKYGDETIDTTQERIARDIASNEADPEKWTKEFLSVLEDFKFVPGGRIISNAGTQIRGTTYINCFVDGFVGKDQDSIGGILEALKRQAFILKSEGGYGFCADVMRPRGGYIEGIANDTPGAVKWLDNWNTQSDVITAGSGRKSGNKKAKQKIRKGAQMVTMSCWHPDIEEFITAKQTSGRLDKFNMSLLITDDFMDAVMNNKKWDLIFPDFDKVKQYYNDNWDGNLGKWILDGNPVKVYKTFKDANELWDLIMKSTYNRNEPGVLFVDTMNRLNNLAYCEYISATNPCIVGDTLIAVADGRNAVSIRQLTEEGKDVPVYSTNAEGRLEIKWGRNPRLTGKKKEVWKLTMDDESTFIATPDHKMYLKNNTYKELKELQVGDSLSSFYSFDSNRGYRQIAQIGQKMIGGRYRNRRQYRVIYEFFNGIGVDYKQFSIHHKDFDNQNDSISNLELMPVEEHKHLHSDRIKGSANPYHRMSDEQKFAFASHPGEKNPKYTGITNDVLLQKAKELYKRDGKITIDSWIKYAKENELPYTVTNDFRFKTFNNFKRQVVDNHKVVSVEFHGYEDVYNITVDDNHNYNVITSFDDNKYIRSGGICVKNCGEQILPIGGVCLLGNLNLTQFIKEDLSGWDYDKLKKVIPVAVRFMDNVNDLTYVPLEDQKDNLMNKRRIGLGILGYGSALLIMKKRYGSPDAIQQTEELMSFIANTAYQSSALLAKEKGPFLLYDEEKYLKSEYLKNLSDETRALIKKHGIRNSHLLSIQPTGNSSILANVASGGLEPVFLFEYVRTVIQPYAPDGLVLPQNVDWVGLSFGMPGDGKPFQEWKWIKEGDENMLKTEFNGVIFKYDRGRGILKESVVKDYGVRFLEQRGEWDPSANWAANINNLKIEEHINSMKVISKYIDSSMSKTINLPSDYKFEDFKHVYIDLYKSGTIKGGTTYRAGTMATVIKKKDEEEVQQATQENNVPKRPKVLECDVVRFTNKGEKWIGFIGLKNASPYEIFTGLAESFVVPGWVEKGFIRKEKVKNKEGVLVSRYDFVYKDKEDYEVIMTGLNRAFQREYWNIGKMTSALLRHHIHLPSVIEIVESLNLDGDVMGTWKKGMTRMLKKYVKPEDGGDTCPVCGSSNLVYKENCISCLDCSWSKCE